MNVIQPQFLKTGDIVSVVATARWVTSEQLQPALDLIHSWGFKTKVAGNVYSRHFQLAGNDEVRAGEFQKALDDPESKAIVVVRGGYGTIRILDKLDFTRFFNHPKWICGYSDITVLHAFLNTRGIATIHSTMPVSFGDATPLALLNLQNALLGNLTELTFSGNNQIPEMTSKVVNGKLIGGNLSVLNSLLGSNTFKIREPSILFLEDVDEMLYHIDRMLVAFLRAGWFNNVSAICVGGMTQMKDNTVAFGFAADNPWGTDAVHAIAKLGEERGIPVLTGLPAGHQADNRAFYLGMDVSLEFSSDSSTILFKHLASDKF